MWSWLLYTALSTALVALEGIAADVVLGNNTESHTYKVITVVYGGVRCVVAGLLFFYCLGTLISRLVYPPPESVEYRYDSML